MIPLALGTQTGGSVIRPASFCGVAAIKPSYRLLPTVGVKCYSWTLDTVGLFAAGVRDVAHGLAAMTGRGELLPQASMPTPRIGIVTQDFAGAPEASGGEALRIATKAAERAGATVRALELPEIVAEAWRVHPVIQEFEAHQALAWEYRENYDAVAPNLRGRLDESKGGTAAEYDEAMRVASRARHALAKVFEEVDVLLTLSAPGAAPKGLGSTGDARYNRLWTLMGVPCVNIPAYVADGGLPVGVQVIARYGADAEALAAARFVEEALKRIAKRTAEICRIRITLSPIRYDRLLRADLAFRARLQPLDVLAMRVEHQQGHHDKQRRQRRVAEPPQEQRRDECRDQRRQRRVAGGEGDGEPHHAEHDRPPARTARSARRYRSRRLCRP